MTNKDEKKLRFKGWNHPDYKYVRNRLRRFWLYEEEGDEQYPFKESREEGVEHETSDESQGHEVTRYGDKPSPDSASDRAVAFNGESHG